MFPLIRLLGEVFSLAVFFAAALAPVPPNSESERKERY